MRREDIIPIDWLMLLIHKFSYSSISVSLVPGSGFTFRSLSSSVTYHMHSLSSADAREGKGNLTMTTPLARESEILIPSDSLAPTTANKSAPPFLFAGTCIARSDENPKLRDWLWVAYHRWNGENISPKNIFDVCGALRLEKYLARKLLTNNRVCWRLIPFFFLRI